MLTYLIKQSRHLLILASLMGMVSGACSVLLVAQINTALNGPGGIASSKLAAAFAAAAAASLLASSASSLLFLRLTQHASAHLRRLLCARVINTDYRKLEEIGGPRVHAALSEHSAQVAQFFITFPVLLTNLVVVIGCLGYLAWLSWPVFLAGALVIGLASLGYHVAHTSAIGHLKSATHEQDRLFDHFRSMVDGAKELRLNRSKRRLFASHVLDTTIEAVRAQRVRGMSIFSVAANWGHFLIYAFIGLAVFVLAAEVPDRTRVTTGFALVFIYMIMPLQGLLLSLPQFNLARLSSARIDEITADLPTDEPDSAATLAPALHTLELRGVCHRYLHESRDEIFAMGPLNLSLEPGQITFIVGGNGSGKTTLAKLIVGLYRPERGDIVFNGDKLGDAQRDHYRQNFSAIFSDFHLFEELLHAPSAELDARGNRLLDKLHLRHKVQIKGGAFSTLALSQGQRKRLALVAAYLEDRPVLLFDEWACDQDPVFKEVFYDELLPELKALNKTVLVISHDDRYFHVADQIVHMEEGQITSITASCSPSTRFSSSLPPLAHAAPG